MRNSNTLILGLLVFVSSWSTAHSDTGIISSYVNVTSNFSAAWYGLEDLGANTVDFQGLDLGVFDLTTASLTLTGAQINTFKNNGGDVTGTDLFYQVYLNGRHKARLF